MHRKRVSVCLLVVMLAALLCFASPAMAEIEPWFMDFFDNQASTYITDARVRPLYRQLMAEASTVPGERDMAVFLDGFLQLPMEQQKRMISGAKVWKLFDSLDVWDAFVLAAHERLSEVEGLPFLREVIAPQRALLLDGEEDWTLDALRLYYGDVGEVGAWTLVPKNPRTGDFLFLAESEKEMPLQAEELVEYIESLSDGALRRTHDPDQASAILVYGSVSSSRGSYPAYGMRVEAYAATARLRASALAMPEEAPLYISISNEPPEQAEIEEGQTVYYSEMPSMLEAAKLPWLVEQLKLMLWHPDEYAQLAVAH